MKRKVLPIVIIICAVSGLLGQPNFTYNDMPGIGDHDSLFHNPIYSHSGDLDSETGNNYTWNFSNLIFNNIFWAVDSFRMKTHPVSAPFTKATLEYFHQEASGNNLELYSYSDDSLYIHRTGGTTGGRAFSPPMAFIKFPIAFGKQSNINAPIFFGANKIGERNTVYMYDGYGKLNMPNNKTYSDVFRIKSVVKDTTYSTGFTTTYTNYLWYIAGGDIPLLRIFKIDINNNSGSIYNVYARKTPPATNTSIEEHQKLRAYVHPNPSSGNFTISSNNMNNGTISIFNSTGKLVYTNKEITTLPTELNLDLKAGIYFLKINSKNDELIHKLLIAK